LFYATGLAKAYAVTEDSAAEAFLARALDPVDFPATIESAYRDGVRLFVEMGPGASCSRMIGAILEERPHRARSACVPGADAVGTILRLLAQLAAERVPLDLNALYGEEEVEASPQPGRSFTMPVGGDPFRVPPPPRPQPAAPPRAATGAPSLALQAGERAQTDTTYKAYRNAHAAFLPYNNNLPRSGADNPAFQTTLLEALVAGGQPLPVHPGVDTPGSPVT